MSRLTTAATTSALALLTGLVGAAPATAATETTTVVARQLDVNPGETNPCTGATGTIIDNEQDVFHITVLADGTMHLSGHSTVALTFTPDDPDAVPYSGHETFVFSENSNRQSFTTTMTQHVRVRGSDGTFITVREVAHLTVSESGARVVFDKPTLLCS